ncbi:MAG: hypothetical protein COB85_08945 [Bacteroidetes bacterium]|nr:MAG: hypothetical protein COB85_08945 [Bacteroidota bacterium]
MSHKIHKGITLFSSRAFSLALLSILIFSGSKGLAQNDEKYYYKLGKKYFMMKDYSQSAKHFYKCADVAKANGSNNPNYYYYPAMLFFYGEGKAKQVLKIMDLIAPLVPEVPSNPLDPDEKKVKFFNDFFANYRIEINKADYIFLRYYIQFKTGQVEIQDVFDRMDYCIRYHDASESKIPISEVYKLLVDIYTDFFKESADVEGYNKENHALVCAMFNAAAEKGNKQAREVVKKNCQ